MGLLAQLPLRDLRLLAPLRGTDDAMELAQLLAEGCHQVAHLELKLSLAQVKALFSLLHGNGSISTLGLSITPERQQSRRRGEARLAAVRHAVGLSRVSTCRASPVPQSCEPLLQRCSILDVLLLLLLLRAACSCPAAMLLPSPLLRLLL